MLIAPAQGFVYLALPKTGTTAIEAAFAPYVQISAPGLPFKHTPYPHFCRYVQKWLNARGYPRTSYEVVTVFRDPVDWLFSWYRYRSREELAKGAAKRPDNYAGDVSFDEFAAAFMRRHLGTDEGNSPAYANLNRPAKFVRPARRQPPVDRIFRYDKLDLLVDYLADRVGEKVKLKRANVSPRVSMTLSPERAQELRAFFAPEYEIYENAVKTKVKPPESRGKRKKA